MTSPTLDTIIPSGANARSLFCGVNAGNATLSPEPDHPEQASANVAFGCNVSYSLTIGNQNVAVGHTVLPVNTVGFNNVGIGVYTLAANDAGNGNVAIGTGCMYSNTTGSHNTAIGLQSLYRNTTGLHNVSIGRDAMFSNTTGNWNVGIGVDAIPGNETGIRNTAVGGEAGYTENMAHQNVTGSYNTWIGSQSGPASAEQRNNCVAIGYRAKNDKDNQVVLGTPETAETVLHGTVIIDGQSITAAQLSALLALLPAA